MFSQRLAGGRGWRVGQGRPGRAPPWRRTALPQGGGLRLGERPCRLLAFGGGPEARRRLCSCVVVLGPRDVCRAGWLPRAAAAAAVASHGFWCHPPDRTPPLPRPAAGRKASRDSLVQLARLVSLNLPGNEPRLPPARRQAAQAGEGRSGAAPSRLAMGAPTAAPPALGHLHGLCLPACALERAAKHPGDDDGAAGRGAAPGQEGGQPPCAAGMPPWYDVARSSCPAAAGATGASGPTGVWADPPAGVARHRHSFPPGSAARRRRRRRLRWSFNAVWACTSTAHAALLPGPPKPPRRRDGPDR